MATEAQEMEKVPVSRLAVLSRLNRKLKARNARLICSRSPLTQLAAGDAYIVSIPDGRILVKHVDVMREAARLGVVRAWERVVDDPADSDEVAS